MSIALMMVCVAASAQSIDVSGTVLEPTGEPVIGATVMQKGTNNGAVTDIDGKFSFKAPQGSVIVVSYIGFATQEVAAAPNLRITLQEEANNLNEVVVTGYTTQRKADLTGAI